MSQPLDILSVLNGRLKNLPGAAYKLQGGMASGHYGLDAVVGSELEVNESEMSVRFPFADGKRRDGVGDLLEVGGIDCSRHRQNPITLFDHGKQVTLPIGLAEDPKTKAYTVEIDSVSKEAWVKAFFYRGGGLSGIDKEKQYDHALFCEQLFDLMRQKYVRSGSIGYQVIAGRKLMADYERGTPEGVHLLAVLLLEASAVVLPANQDTAAKVLALPNCCGKPLSPHLVKSFAPFAPEKKVMLSVPHGDEITETRVPPVTWKPGLGAIKELRKRYREKAALTRNLVKQPYDELLDPIKPGDTAISRRQLAFHYTEPLVNNNPVFVRSGEKVQVLEMLSGGTEVRVRNDAGQTSRQQVRDFRKGLEQNKKSLPLADVRKKYRPTKGLRRRLKKSSPGASIAYVNSKDLDACRQLAASKGVKLQWIGDADGASKIKLMGDDSSCDDVVKMFGIIKRVKSMSKKGFNESQPRASDGKFGSGGGKPSKPGKFKPGSRCYSSVDHRGGEVTEDLGGGDYRIKLDNGEEVILSESSLQKKDMVNVGRRGSDLPRTVRQQAESAGQLNYAKPVEWGGWHLVFAPGTKLSKVAEALKRGGHQTRAVDNQTLWVLPAGESLKSLNGEKSIGVSDYLIAAGIGAAIGTGWVLVDQAAQAVGEWVAGYDPVPPDDPLGRVRKQREQQILNYFGKLEREGKVERRGNKVRKRAGKSLFPDGKKELRIVQESDGWWIRGDEPDDANDMGPFSSEREARQEAYNTTGTPPSLVRSKGVKDIHPNPNIAKVLKQLLYGMISDDEAQSLLEKSGMSPQEAVAILNDTTSGTPTGPYRQRKGSKSMRRQIKSAPEGLDEAMVDESEVKDFPAPEDEKYGAQVLRRVHGDSGTLMSEYHDMIGTLEHEDVKSFLEEVQADKDRHMTKAEELFSKHYSDHAPLEGAMDSKDIDEDDSGMDEEVKELDEDDSESTDADGPADSKPIEEPTEEEVIEGMEAEQKRLIRRSKSLRKRIKNMPARTKEYTVAQFSEGRFRGPTPQESYYVLDGTDPNTAKKVRGPISYDQANRLANEMNRRMSSKDFTADEVNKVEGDLEEVQDEVADQFEDTEQGKALEPHELAAVKSAHGYLKELADPGHDFSDESRMKAFHHHSCLEPIGAKAGIDASIGVEASPAEIGMVAGMSLGVAKRKKSVPGSPEWEAEERDEPEHKGWHKGMDCRTAVAGASKYLKRLSTTKAISMADQEEAAEHAGNLEPFVQDKDQEPPVEDDVDTSMEEEIPEPGDMGQKALNEDLKQAKQLKELTERLTAVASRF